MAKKRTGKRSAPSLIARAKKIRVLLMDVDGVLTDGRIWLLSRRDGTASEIKGFSAYDGAGLKLARAAGLRTGIITGRDDDLPDLSVLQRVGLAVAVANAVPEVKRAAHFVTSRSGGEGAVREVIELIVKAQGKWAAASRDAKA